MSGRTYYDLKYNREAITRLRDAMRLDSQDHRIIQDSLDAAFREREEALFVSEGASGGSPWAQLSPDYARRKAAAGSAVRKRNRSTRGISMERPVSQKILRWSENLMRSLTRAGHSEHISRVVTSGSQPVFEAGTSNPLASYHANGVPARNPVAHTDEQRMEYLNIVREYVLKKLAAVTRSLRTVGGL